MYLAEASRTRLSLISMPNPGPTDREEVETLNNVEIYLPKLRYTHLSLQKRTGLPSM